MEYRQLGRSGLKISVLTMGTITMGGKGNFAKVGNVGSSRSLRAHPGRPGWPSRCSKPVVHNGWPD
jgi:hypothetical protein